MKKFVLFALFALILGLTVGCDGGVFPNNDATNSPNSSFNPSSKPSSSPTPTPTPVDELSGYSIVWKDEFNDTNLDTNKWKIDTSARHSATNSARAIKVADGLLTITTFTEAGKHYTGFLDSSNKYEPLYGFFEARIKFSSTPGEWGAFWLQSNSMGNPIGDPSKAGVEIDVMEHRQCTKDGTDISGQMISTIHWDGYGSNHKRSTSNMIYANPDKTTLAGEWHVYGVLWTKDGYTFYLDGKPFWSTKEAISNVKEHLRLTCEVWDKEWAGNIPAAGYGTLETSKTNMQVDWVKVWQKK